MLDLENPLEANETLVRTAPLGSGIQNANSERSPARHLSAPEKAGAPRTRLYNHQLIQNY